MTVSVIEKLRRSRGENTWLEDLKAGSTEQFVDKIRGLLEDPEWDYGPAKLVGSYLTGKTKYVLAEKSEGTVLRVHIEGDATKFRIGDVELREVPESIPTMAEEVLNSARALVDHVMNEDSDAELDVESTLVALGEALRRNPNLDKDIALDLALATLAEDKLWYAGQLPESATTSLNEETATDKALSTLKGRVASVIELIKESGEIEPGLAVIVESVLEHSEKAIHLLNSILSEGGSCRKALRVMASVPTVDKALVFIQNELSESADSRAKAENLDQEAEIQ